MEPLRKVRWVRTQEEAPSTKKMNHTKPAVNLEFRGNKVSKAKLLPI